MALQNRVRPDGVLVAHPARGTMLGNRGGQLHDPATKTLTARRWASNAWITCETEFRGRRRPVMGRGYTELFFLDEVTALAAGHRPCFECRRADARAFAESWARSMGLDKPPKAGEMDRVLHGERLAGRDKQLHDACIDELPDGAMVVVDGAPHAVRGARLLPWRFEGYGPAVARPVEISVCVLTPPAILGVLAAGYCPRWHESAGA
ncbi:hypothetical protein GGD81_003190 [Rhodobium orientis]|uniref:Uncharacterized protein n=1 Tax=Rhodobium orientis TaxID=34017 RepID=A0A327JFJ1_9HYPH|nr:hypothetical protein [Rhodobium orientis]MBB4304134.1 hypothetical protein [Rhodobium orientis]MBK5948642.1 hypothetical protein [Rhodobium orientis]RAI24885.1 hypothetical protein CH339_20645 [Rhodobium orientis]